jgi:ASC-1-like (ASCH) protein
LTGIGRHDDFVLYEDKSRIFYLLERGLKKVEFRLNDEKRGRIKIGDKIIFKKLNDSSFQATQGEEINAKKFFIQ